MDATSISTALASLRVAGDILKAVTAAGNAMGEAQLKMTIADLAGHLSDARLSVVEAQEEIRRLEQRVRDAEEMARLRGVRSKRNDTYWVGEGERPDGPFCTRCWDVLDKPVHMIKAFNGYAQCPECKSSALAFPGEAREFRDRRAGYIEYEP